MFKRYVSHSQRVNVKQNRQKKLSISSKTPTLELCVMSWDSSFAWKRYVGHFPVTGDHHYRSDTHGKVMESARENCWKVIWLWIKTMTQKALHLGSSGRNSVLFGSCWPRIPARSWSWLIAVLCFGTSLGLFSSASFDLAILIPWDQRLWPQMGVSENVVYPIVPSLVLLIMKSRF